MKEACKPEINTDEFPSTRYRGSKRKIIPWIHKILKDLEFETALDLFGGTASVSYLLKKMGKTVTYNDSLRFNYLIGQALIANDSVRLSATDLAHLLGPTSDEESLFITRTFGGMYFTKSENRWIDGVCRQIRELETQAEGEMKSALAHYALFQACLTKRPFNLFHRKNLYLRRARVKRTFGNKTTWDRSFAEQFLLFAAEGSKAVFEGKGKCVATNWDASEFPQQKFDLIYLDPPYLRKEGFQETADYRKCYHFLEGVANYREWPGMIDLTTRTRRLRPDRENSWCDPKTITSAFDELLGRFESSLIAISYRKHGVPSLGTLARLLRRHGWTASIHTRHYKYALNHQNGDAQFNREALILGMKR